MRVYDKVRLILDRAEYKAQGAHKGMIGRINSGEIRDNCFQVNFIDQRFWSKKRWDFLDMQDDIIIAVRIADLELVEEANTPDDWLLQELPSPDKHWWCIVEDGYIKNMLGEKKNKIPYDYDS